MKRHDKTLTVESHRKSFSQEYASFDGGRSMETMLKLFESKAEFTDLFHKLASLEAVMIFYGVSKEGLDQVRATMHHLIILRDRMT